MAKTARRAANFALQRTLTAFAPLTAVALGVFMQRDMDIVRRILLAVRQAKEPVTSVEGVPPQQFAMHAQILDEAGLVVAALGGGDNRIAVSAMIYRLTWDGHEFADSIIDDTLWKKAKEHVIKPSASWTFSLLLEYLKAEIRRHIPGLDGPL